MRYRNPSSGLEINLGELDDKRQRLFDAARKQFRQNTSWFDFEQLVFSYTSPLFQGSRSRADVVHDPLFKALKDMWLQLGIDQGFVAHERTTEAAARPARAYGPSYIRDVAPPREPRPPRKRSRKS